MYNKILEMKNAIMPSLLLYCNNTIDYIIQASAKLVEIFYVEIDEGTFTNDKTIIKFYVFKIFHELALCYEGRIFSSTERV